MLKHLATDPAKTKGRILNESECVGRSVFQRDRDRIIHSGAFRRLVYKTQVFVCHEGDHYRNRLTHSLEVAQVARSISRQLELCEDLAEAIALAHDLGHTPFGHVGEDVLNKCMKDYGGFDHNAQTLKIVTFLEQKYASFDGLNLSYETLEGIAKHNGPLIGKYANLKRPLSSFIIGFNNEHDLQLDKFASLEAQVAAIADDIAYTKHDIEDGVRAGFFTIYDLEHIDWIKTIVRSVTSEYPNANLERTTHEVTRSLVRHMINDTVTNIKSAVKNSKIEKPEQIVLHHESLVKFPDLIVQVNQDLRKFLFNNMYRHYRVNRMSVKAEMILNDLFKLYFEHPNCMPTEWSDLTKGKTETEKANVIANFIAGMTDRFAIEEHESMFGFYK